MYLEVQLIFQHYRAWLLGTPRRGDTWREAFQRNFGNIFTIVPVGANAHRFPRHHHPFHILGPSPWPFCLSLSLLTLVSGLVDLLDTDPHYGFTLSVGLVEVLVCLWCWWKDVVEESLTQHTKRIKRGIAIGMVLFIISEVMFFFSFFWAFFHVSLAPSIELGCVWPPKGLEALVISPFGAPLLNTALLLASGVTLTCAHHAFLVYCYKQRRLADLLNAYGQYLIVHAAASVLEAVHRLGAGAARSLQHNAPDLVSVRLEEAFNRIQHQLYFRVLWGALLHPTFRCCFRYFVVTLALAIFFTISQGAEYVESAISISDGVYGSTFFVMTGFHGFHVLVGTVFLAVCFGRILMHRYSFVHFVGLECAIWYWHFVDVVWLFLFFFVYYWGNAFVPVVDYSLFGTVAHADFAHPFQPDFQDSASVLMESIVDLHNYIMFYLWVVLGVVVWMLVAFVVSGPAAPTGQLWGLLRLVLSDLRSREFAVRRLFFLTNRDAAKRFPGLAKWALRYSGPAQRLRRLVYYTYLFSPLRRFVRLWAGPGVLSRHRMGERKFRVYRRGRLSFLDGAPSYFHHEEPLKFWLYPRYYGLCPSDRAVRRPATHRCPRIFS